MNIATIMGKIKNVPKIIKNADGKEEAVFLVETERNYKNSEGKVDKDTIECRLVEPRESFKEEFTKGTNIAVQGKLNISKKDFGENKIDNLVIDVKDVVDLSKNHNSATVSIVGHLTMNPELRETTNGKKVTNIVIATTKENKNDEPIFIRTTLWDKRAENVAKYCLKGDLINITGNLRTNNRENGEEKVSVTELVANEILFIHSKNRSNSVEQDKDKEQEMA